MRTRIGFAVLRTMLVLLPCAAVTAAPLLNKGLGGDCKRVVTSWLKAHDDDLVAGRIAAPPVRPPTSSSASALFGRGILCRGRVHGPRRGVCYTWHTATPHPPARHPPCTKPRSHASSQPFPQEPPTASHHPKP